MKSTFIAWTRYNRRSDLLAQHFGATMHHIARGQPGTVLNAPYRYWLQSLETWRVLRREKPDIIFVQNPPLPCVVVAHLYARRYGARYVIDSHTGAFLSPKWRWSIGLHRLLSRDAVTTIVTNEALRQVVNSWGCHASIVGFTPANYPVGEDFPISDGFNLAVIQTGAEDEPLDAVVDAARMLPDVNFYVTGAIDRIPKGTLTSKPANCHLTGYLPYERYVGLLRGVDIVVDLTTRNHTLLLGAFEAVSIGTPIIVSDWPLLREYFSRGAIYVDNTSKGIWEGVLHARREREALRTEVLQLRDNLHAEWDQKFSELQTLLAANTELHTSHTGSVRC